MRFLCIPYLLICLIFCSCSNVSKNEKATLDTDELEITNSLSPKINEEFMTITFPSLDSLEISADLFHVVDKATCFVLCHQAQYNRTEYTETAKILMGRGYNCLAIDQRSGGNLNEKDNDTAKKAADLGLGMDYLDAEPDIVAAVNYMAKKYKQPIVLVGSSYSAALGLKIAKENPNVKAVLSFSPGEYFGSKLALAKSINGLNKPTFITSSKKEATAVQALVNVVNKNQITHFIPKSEGAHGSKALWSEQSFNAEYWTAVNAFLKLHKL